MIINYLSIVCLKVVNISCFSWHILPYINWKLFVDNVLILIKSVAPAVYMFMNIFVVLIK